MPTVHFKTLVWKFKDTSLNYPDSDIPKKQVTSPREFYTLFNPIMAEEPRELFMVAWLSSHNRVQGYEIVTSGLLNSSLVDPRLVFRGAIIANCAAVIVAHNHPSGNLEPSEEDVRTTRQLVEAGKIIGINVHDHLIFTDRSYTSFAERGLI